MAWRDTCSRGGSRPSWVDRDAYLIALADRSSATRWRPSWWPLQISGGGRVATRTLDKLTRRPGWTATGCMPICSAGRSRLRATASAPSGCLRRCSGRSVPRTAPFGKTDCGVRFTWATMHSPNACALRHDLRSAHTRRAPRLGALQSAHGRPGWRIARPDAFPFPFPVPFRAAARFPIVRAPMLVRNGDDCRRMTVHVIPNGVRKPIEDVEVDPITVRRPHIGSVAKSVDRLKHLRSEGVRSNRTAIKVAEQSLLKPLLGFGQNLDGETSHIALMRARTSDQGAACTTPARSSCRRRSSSARQASATDPSSLVSRLSIKAAATAERSSAESRRTSSSTWSTRAFIPQSIAVVAAAPPPQQYTSSGRFRRRLLRSLRFGADEVEPFATATEHACSPRLHALEEMRVQPAGSQLLAAPGQGQRDLA